MTNTGILAASALLLFAYALEHVGRRFKVPPVVLLIGTGLIARQILDAIGVRFHWVDPMVPVLGTLGLILIVLEGALDLTVTRKRAGVMLAAAASSFLGFCLTLGAFAFLFVAMMKLSVAAAMLAAIPFAVISSAVAIPSASALPTQPREFIVYESSLSDILGVLVFYSWLTADGSLQAFAADLFGGGALSLVVALVAAMAVFYFINQITGHVRFLPLLAGLVLLYAIGKEIHLSPLIVVLVCGLLINNPHLVTWHSALRNFQTPQYEETLSSFKALVAELTFACKSFFFLLLGYWTEVNDMLSIEAWLVAVAGISFILFSRYAILALLRRKAIAQLVWIAPRGLITVLLFLSARRTGEIDSFPFGSVMLVVLITSALTALAHRTAPAAANEAAAPPLGAVADAAATGPQAPG